MQILKAYKFRLEPTEQQAQRLRQLGGCARYVWNHGLAETKRILGSFSKTEKIGIAALVLGGAILFHSTELNELVNMCDEVMVMYKGEMVEKVVGDHLSEEALMQRMLGAVQR